MTTDTATQPLWISNGGRIVCPRHGGAYLDAAISAKPKAKRHVTPLDSWTLVSDGDRATWRAIGHGEMTCETCACEARS